jgi:hypothetical protein
LDSQIFQLIVFPIGTLYLLLHLGPLVGLWYEPSIRGGTRWRFFASELVVFTLWLLGSPVLVRSPLGRVAIAAHLVMHTVFTVLDAVAHDFVLDTALVRPRKAPVLWFLKSFGLLLDTACHATAVALVAVALGPLTAGLLFVPALVGFALVTRGYLRDHAPSQSSA